MEFKDHFSRQAVDYAKYRPTYPRALYEHLAELAPQRQVAWDCATGNGQAAVALSEFFESVVATDASENQLAQVNDFGKIEFRKETAERCSLRDKSMDLITVAQAFHWFDAPKFFSEVRRVAKDGGILALWMYNLSRTEDSIDPIVDDFYFNVVGPYWPQERGLIESGYRTVDFPFAEIQMPSFQMSMEWDLDTYCGYLSTWSAVQRFRAARHSDPIPLLKERMQSVWGNPSQLRKINWPLALRVGKCD